MATLKDLRTSITSLERAGQLVLIMETRERRKKSSGVDLSRLTDDNLREMYEQIRRRATG